MTIILLGEELIERLGWTLVHSLWIGAAVGVLHAGLMAVLRRKSAQTRYVAGCAVLALFMGGVVAGFLLQGGGSQVSADRNSAEASLHADSADHARPVRVASSDVGVPADAGLPEPAPTVRVERETVGAKATEVPASVVMPTMVLREHAARLLEPALPWAVLGWVCGIGGLGIWQFMGWLGVLRLRRCAAESEAGLIERVAQLARRLGILRAVAVMESALVRVPTVIGWLRPVILLPAGFALGLSPGQVEAILAHELSHIRRHDYLVNLVQTLVETLLFYHPATWVIGRRIRREREHCCDDAVMALGADGRQYAESLLEVARQSAMRGAALGMAATGHGRTSELRRRIARLMGEEGATPRHWSLALAALLLTVALLVPVACMRGAGAAQSEAGLKAESGAEAYDWPAKLRAGSLTGLWVLRRTDNPGPEEANIYEMVLNADKTWAEVAVWGKPEKPTKVEVMMKGPDWGVSDGALGQIHLMRWRDAAHSSGASTVMTSAKTSEFTLQLGNGIVIWQKYERAGPTVREVMRQRLEGSGVSIGETPVTAALEWPGKPDAQQMIGTWYSDQHSPDREYVYLTIHKDGAWRLGRFYGSAEAPVRAKVDQQGPDWRLTDGSHGVSVYFHQLPLATGGDASWLGQMERLTNNELKMPPRSYRRASADLEKALAIVGTGGAAEKQEPVVAAREEFRDLFPICDQGRWGYIDATGKVVIAPAYEASHHFSEGLAAVRSNGKYGYIDKTGRIVIAAQFLYGFDFHEGLAWVENGMEGGFVDATGKIVVRPPADMRCRQFREGLALTETVQYLNDSRASMNTPRKAGFIDKSGKYAIEPRFDAAFDFAEGLAAVCVAGKWGFIDKAGKMVIAARYDKAMYFSEGLANVTEGGRAFFIDIKGQRAFSKDFDEVVAFKEGLCSVKVGEKWGFIDKTGAMVIAPRFDEGTSFLNGRAAVEVNKKYGYIDKTGRMVVEPAYAYGHFFLGELAGVSVDPLKSDGSNYIYINAAGRVVWQPTAATTQAAGNPGAAHDPDVAALLTAIRPLAGWTLERRDGSVQPIKLEPGRGIELAFPPVRPVAAKLIPLTLWIMDGDYKANRAPPMSRPGTPVAGLPRELDRWNGRQVFLFENDDKGWPDAVPRIEEALRATSGPLVAALVVERVEGKDTLQFELRNRSDGPVKVCSTRSPTSSRNMGYAVYGVSFMPEFAISDNMSPEGWRKQVVTLKAGELVRWPVGNPPLTPGDHAKFDASYNVFPDAAKDIDIWGGWVVAPTADVRVDDAGQMTVTAWKPARISPAVNAASLIVAGQMEKWTADLGQQLKELAEGITPEIRLNTNPSGELSNLSCKVAYNCTFIALGDGVLKFEGATPALALRVSARRSGDWNDVALAKDAAAIAWDGKAIFRTYRVPGTDWIVMLAAQSNNADLAQKANAMLDSAYNQLAKIAAQAPNGTVPTTAPAGTDPEAMRTAIEQARMTQFTRATLIKQLDVGMEDVPESVMHIGYFWKQSGDRMMFLRVNLQGKGSVSWATDKGSGGQVLNENDHIKADGVRAALAKIPTLPASQAADEDRFSLAIRFKKDGKWETQEYDVRHPPAALADLLTTLGGPWMIEEVGTFGPPTAPATHPGSASLRSQ